MRITSLEVLSLSAPVSEFASAILSFGRRAATLVRVATDGGLVGWGEAIHPAAGRLVREVLAAHIIGQNVLNRRQAHRAMVTAYRPMNLQRGLMAAAIGAVDIALWDLAGKALNVPVHRLLGGAVRTRVPVYASGLYYRSGEGPAQLAAEAESYIGQGFGGVKMKIGRNAIAEDMGRIAAVRRVTGDNIRVMVDANQAYCWPAAVEMGLRLEDLGVYWFEEPIPVAELAGYRQLSSRLRIRIAAGENLHGRADFAPFLSEGLIGVAQPNVGNVGGITEFMAVAALAETWGVPFALHGWGSAILNAAAVHVAACLPPCPDVPEPLPYLQEPVLEYDCSPNPLRDVISPGALQLQNGALRVPDGPGLGVEVDEAALQPYLVDLDK
jgi:D-galactarolactone cycloisomerase